MKKVNKIIGMILLPPIVYLIYIYFIHNDWNKNEHILFALCLIIGLINSLILIYQENKVIIQNMKINRNIILKTSFAFGLIIAFIGAYLNISHRHDENILIIIEVLITLIFDVTALYEILRSTHIDRSEKIMWTIFIILFNYIAGLVYLLSGRKRIIQI